MSYQRLYQPKTLISNWFENRLEDEYKENDNKNRARLNGIYSAGYKTTHSNVGSFTKDYKQKDFPCDLSGTVVNYQKSLGNNQYISEMKASYVDPVVQDSPFKIMETSLTKDKEALHAYRQTWTHGDKLQFINHEKTKPLNELSNQTMHFTGKTTHLKQSTPKCCDISIRK